LETLQHEISKSAAQLANEGAGDTAGNILHDLNSPLTVINGFIELIHKQVQKAASLEGEELEKMKASIGRVHSQVVRCLEISKRYLGVRGFQKEAVDERVAVNDVLIDLQELLSKHPSSEGRELTISELDESTHAAISGTSLLRILINLALNGLQSAESAHRVNVIAQCLPKDFDMTGFKNGTEERFVASDKLRTGAAMVAISVRDNGPGIPANIVEKLFNERFTSKPVGKGSGLGLGSVKNLITEAKGAIRLITKPGQGTTFTVFLPLAS
jgi:signal transduction histidine kinase